MPDTRIDAYGCTVRGPACNPARAAARRAHIEVMPPCDAHATVRLTLAINRLETRIDLPPAEARALAHALLSACDVPDAS